MERLVDTLGRPVRDLRISVTDRCNFRCVYCMPKEVFGRDYALPAAHGPAHLRGDRAPRRASSPASASRRSASPAASRSSAATSRRLVGAPRRHRRARPHADDQRRAAREQGASGCKDAGLNRITVSLDSLDDEVFRAMNDVDFPVARVLDGHRRRRSRPGSTRSRSTWWSSAALNEDAILAHGRGTSAAPASSLRFIEYMDVGHTNGWRMDDVVPAAEIVGAIDAELPLEPVEPAYRGEVAERWRYRDGERRDRRHRLGDAAVLRRLHARAPLDRRQALHLPLRRPGPRPARAAARRRLRRRAGRRGRGHLARPRGPLLGAPLRRDSPTRERVEMSYIGG